MIIVGLTGSIGMGKSATAGLFREMGVAVHDSDAAVHAIYADAAEVHLAADFPQAFPNGRFDRSALAALVVGNPEAMRRLEAIVHPLVSASRVSFLDAQRARSARVAVLDVPLLFETGLSDAVDICLVVTAPPELQRRRVLARPGMSLEKFEAINARQLADAHKRSRAHWIIDTSHGIPAARRDVIALLRSIVA